MKTLKKFGAMLSVAAFLSLGAGCGGDLVKKIDKLADEACACKDAACAKKVMEKFETLGKEADKADKPSKGDMEKMEKSMKRLMECVTKLQGAG